METRDTNDRIIILQVKALEWSFKTKEYAYADNDSCQGYRLILYEPIVFRFSIRDHRSNFYFFVIVT